MIKMLDLILTVLFGWAGYWKFKNNKIGLGIVWLLTFGAFGFGWLFDIVCALVAYLNNAKTKQRAAPGNALSQRPAQEQEAAPRSVSQPVTAQRPDAPVTELIPRQAPQTMQHPTVPVSMPDPQPVQQRAAAPPLVSVSKPVQQRSATSAPVPATQQDKSAVELLQDIEDTIRTEPLVQFSIKFKSGADTVDLSSKPKDVEQIPELSHLDFGKPAGSAGRFLNYGRYKVFGMRDNGRKSFLIRTGRTPEDAANKIKASELLPPYEAVEIAPEPPSERQIALLVRHGTAYPPELTSDDASAMIDRICYETRRHGPDSWLVNLADGIGTEFSAYVGGSQLFDLMIYQAGKRDRAALYAYAVQQSLAGKPFENMLADPSHDRFYAFADVVAADASLVKSLEGREPSDYLKPQRGTKIFKAAAAFLAGGTP